MKKQPAIFKKESYDIIGVAMAVHRELGLGFLEAIYQEALEEELKTAGIPYVREDNLNVYYKNKLLSKSYQADFICYGEIILELKASSDMSTSHQSQLINYLRVANLKLGLLINFGKTSLEYKRIINTQYKPVIQT